MTNHFYAVDPQGQTHTRNSASRTYTHTVLVRLGRQAVDRYYAFIEPAAEQAGKSYDETVRHSQGLFAKRDLCRGPQALQFWQDHAIKFLAEDEDYSKGRDHVVEHARQFARQQAESFEADKRWDRYECAGWCGRPDLAAKLASQQQAENVVVVEAIVGKPPKKGG